MSEGAAALRGAAARWSLAGDQQLLDLLQEIHQRIISRCNETNQRLEEMSRGLRDASVNLQNVNNKFLALSNTQFVESRVYEDDADVAPPAGVEKEQPKPVDLSSDLTKLKQSLQILESYHEPLLIVGDSDESDSEGDDERLVLKPKDLYADRPLPYIIGSQAWRNKWHAGLVPDESDSDSSTSKVEEPEVYSDSEEEENYVPATKVSSDSSSLHSDVAVSVSPVRPSPSAVAAELARRLGGDVKIPEREPVYTQPEPVVRKLYKPQEPLATTIFPDEPPPLDDASSDDDIFAELHKTQPKLNSNTVGDVFDFNKSLDDALFGAPKVQTNQSLDKPLFAAAPETDVTEKPAANEQPDDIKKPVGGISLFGTSKHAESIGAAILKRNRRKSSTSGDESNTEEVKVVKEAKEVKERDIFDDLFAKSEKLNKKNAKKQVVETKYVVKTEEVKKKDVFSDIFDDIDDIFSSDIVNVKIKETKNNEKSLFSDDDDLFAEISKVNKNEVTPREKTDKFTDVAQKVEKVQAKENLFSNVKKEEKREVRKENKIVKEVKETKGLFDSDSDDGLFTNVSKEKRNVTKTEKSIEDNLFDEEDDGLFTNKAKNVSKKNEVTSNTKDSVVSKALFDSDDDLFKDTKAIKKVEPKNSNIIKNVVENIKNDGQSLVTPVTITTEKPDNKKVKIETKPKAVDMNPTVIDSINNDPDDSPFETSHGSFDNEEIINKSNKNYVNEITNLTTETAGKLDKEFQDIENSASISDDMYGTLEEPTYFKENILRTTRIGSDEDNIPTKTEAKYILNDSDDELFKNTPKVLRDSDVFSQAEGTPAMPDTPELFTTPSNKNDIFSDIFADAPPIFEKPKESKKSKNVNALFDDDSDDEALFFKKSDPITDEKPTLTPSDERFGIFNDEPPAIDVDITQKSRHEEVTRSGKTDEILPILDKTDGITTKSLDAVTKSNKDNLLSKDTQDTTDNTSKESKKIGKLKPMNFNINVNTLLPGAFPKKKQVETTEVHTASNEELHKTDKIEPAMVKSISFDDPEILDNKISKERAKIQVKRRPSTRRARKEAVRKSAIDFTDSSFDSSNDNSTKEEVQKVVKTVYILNDDDIFGSKTQNVSTEHTKKHLNIVDSDEELFESKQNTDKNDNVSRSIDNVSAIERKSSVDSNDNDDLFKKTINPINVAKDEIDATVNKENQNKVKSSLDTNENVFKTNVDQAKQESSKEFNKITDDKSFLDSDDGENLFKAIKTSTVVDKKEPLDSDEELFRKPSKNKVNNEKAKTTKSFLSSDDDDDLFKTKTKESIKSTLKSNVYSDEEDLFKKGIGTLGKVYNKKEDDKEVNETHSIFDDFPAKSTDNDNTDTIKEKKTNTIREEIDKTVKTKTNKQAKTILDDLSDEDDLFKSKTKLLNRNNKSLFGDDDDDDNLFGSKPAKEVKQEVPVSLPTKETKAAEPVFVDPLSLFGDEE